MDAIGCDLGKQPGAMESRDDPVNQVRHFMERFSKRLTLDNLRLGERYLKSELLLLVRFIVGAKNEEFIACFEREPCVGESEEHGQVGNLDGRIRRGLPQQLNHVTAKINAPD